MTKGRNTEKIRSWIWQRGRQERIVSFPINGVALAVANDLNLKTGFHGRRPDITGVECKHCHTDHKGRKADIVQFDPQTFNHRFTDFELKGAHTTVLCESCHAPAHKFRMAAGTCIGCHKKDEPHKGQLGDDCAKCHNETSWRKSKSFDHSKTKFPLEGAHNEVQCAVCHIGERYKGLPTACSSCHQLQDAHEGRYGAKCEMCHVPKKWLSASFDHDKLTKFPLKGGHKTVKCDTCHAGDLYRDKLSTTCVSCHKASDLIKGNSAAIARNATRKPDGGRK